MKEAIKITAIITLGAIGVASVFACPEISILTVIVLALFIAIISAG